MIYESKNTTCQASGHLWISTTAVNFRMCGRSQCDAAQRWCLEGWLDANHAPQPRMVEDALYGRVKPSERRTRKGKPQPNVQAVEDLRRYWS